MKQLAVFASLLCALLTANSACADRVTWRASGVITSVGSNAQTLPFSAAVGQTFAIDMTLERDTTLFSCCTSGATAAYNNLYSAVVYVGNSQLAITPAVTGTTTMWNNFLVASTAYDYYNLSIVDAATQWQARWWIQAITGVSTGPINSLTILQSPPDLTAFGSRGMTLTPSGGSYAAAITASLDSLTVTTAASPPPDNSGGGAFSIIMLVALSALRMRAVFRQA